MRRTFPASNMAGGRQILHSLPVRLRLDVGDGHPLLPVLVMVTALPLAA